MRHEIDDTDREIIAHRMARINKNTRPRTGDWTDFPGGISRRISCIWPGGSIQTASSGSWHLGDYGVTCSAAMYQSIPRASLTFAREHREGDLWIFHHDSPGRDRDVHFEERFRVYRCSLEAPET